MPTYDYLCTECSYKFDHFQNITSPPLRKCPFCGKQTLKRLIGAGGGLIFKGSGWPGQEIARKEASNEKQ